MNKTKNKSKMGFLRINSLKAAFLAVIAALALVVITANVSNSSTNEPTETTTNSDLVIHLTDSNFQNTIKEGVTLVDFWAVWCAPCRMQGPIIEEVATEIGDKATIAKLDVDKNSMTSRRYGIRNIPTMMIFKDGELVQTFVGLKDKNTLLSALKNHIDK